MKRLRNRLVLAFIATTAIPLAATLWITLSLVERSLSLDTAREVDELSRSLERAAREFYQLSREQLRADAQSGRLQPRVWSAADRASWPEPVKEFHAGGEAERFHLAGASGNRLEYFTRRGPDALVYVRPLGAVSMHAISRQYAEARELVETRRGRDVRRGFLYTFLLLAAAVGVVTVVIVLFTAHRIGKPIQQLTGALTRLSAGDLSVRVQPRRRDEIGLALEAFNHMAGELQQNRERLVFLTRLAGWQALGRKMAHELKNSLTPIRLTAEEIVARQAAGGEPFLEQAAQIIVDEVNRLERRVRAFSELAAEPPVNLGDVDLNSLVEERVAFLKTAHPELTYEVTLHSGEPAARADIDLLRGVLTNLLENAADAAGPGGLVLVKTDAAGARTSIEVHDSGPGLSGSARAALFEPTISFKKKGMGLGLSIARKSALLCGGDIELVKGELGGAAFRVMLPAAAAPALAPPAHAWAKVES
ncbi:MAG: HAMP domain-containing protein [Bryobacteraceae bacterium]|nr:HAMP domain-containing protein [Bryobacteraceae bacterium]